MSAPLVWQRAWNDIIRMLFFDPQLHELMMIPDGTSILDFIDRYLIQVGYTSKTLKNQNVRIIWSILNPKQTDAEGVVKAQLHFDIYVRDEHLHDCDYDRLMSRTQMISQRIIYLLTKQKRYISDGWRFWCIGDMDNNTSAIGYTRYSTMFGFMRVYN